jgi:pectin methylesterase-like acyl-CoA thioesterase
MFLTSIVGNVNTNTIKLFASDTTNSRKIDVWDFGGVQTSGDLYNNNISINTLDNLATVTAGLFTGSTVFGDLSITTTADIKDRLYYFKEDGKTIGVKSYSAIWGNATKLYADGYNSNGCYYCNGTAGIDRRFFTINNVVAGDNITVYGGTSNGNEEIHLLYLGTDGAQDTVLPFTTTASRVDLVAKYSGTYKIYVSAAHSGKPYFHRVVRTPGVKVSGKVNLNGNVISSGYSLTLSNQTTGDTTDVTVNSDNTFDTVLPAGYSYTAVLKGTPGYKITNETKVVTTSSTDIAAGISNINLDVMVNSLATISGSIKGFESSYDVSKLQIKLAPPAGSLASEVGVTVDKATMTYTATVDASQQYTAVISGVNDYELISGGSVKIDTNLTQDITVAKKAVYLATGKFMNLSATAQIQKITFTNVEDGYTYTGTVANGGYTASLRNGSYTVTAVCTENYETTTHVIVNGQDTTKDIKFNLVTGWNLVNVTSQDITSTNYKGLTLQGGATYFGVNGNALRANPGAIITIPVVAGQIVTVSGWYSGEICFNNDQANKLVIPGTSSASAPAKLSYKATTTGTVTLNVVGTATAYLTAIDRVQQLDRVSDLYVGDSSKANNFSTVKEALDAAAKMNPTSEAERITIHIAPGVYRAQLKISTPYISLVNSNPSQEVKITWYYGFGYEYYSVGADGFYSEDRSFDKYSKYHVSEGKWGGSVYLTSTAKEFKAENIVFENSFNKYITKEELEDGVALCKTFPQSTSINVPRTASTDVTSKAATERAAAMIIEGDNVEFYNCSFIGSQDTLYTGGVGTNNQYYKNCFIEGNTDYIFGDGNVVFDNAILNFCGYSDSASGGYITAAKDLATYGYLFRNSKVTANNNNKQIAGFFGRPWGPKAKVKFVNTKLESSSIIDPKGWAEMSGATPENANFAEYNTTYNDAKVDTSARRAPVLNDETSIATSDKYFGTDWTPKYYVSGVSDANTLVANTTVNNKTGEVNFAISDSKHPQDNVTILVTNTKDNSVAYTNQAVLDSNGNYTFTTTLPDGSYVGTVNGINGKAAIQPFIVQIEKESFEWKITEFGASTSSANNTVVVDDTNKTATITAGTKDGSKTGGKLTGSQDGISYYYTEIDPSKNFEISADVKVNFFAKTPPDGQEGFGLMARDAIGNNGDSSVFASNMVMVGGYGGAKNIALIQSVFRNGVKDSTGAGATMEDVFKFGDRPANDGTATYKLTMKKTNTGYQVSVNNGKEKIYYRPKQLEVLNKDKIYVGFFAARVASITVSNIDMKTSDVATDPAGLPEPPRPVTPAASITSRAASSTANYDLKVSPNVNGTMQVKLAGAELYNGSVEAGKELIVKSTLASGDNSFDVTFTPGVNENVTSYAPVTVTKVVTYRSYGVPGGAIYASQAGTVNGQGTENDPIDIYSAVNFAGEGQTIYVRGGVYNLTAPLIIDKGNNGTADKLKVLSAYPNERPVFDFGTRYQGLTLAGDWWKVYGIDVTRTSSTGFKVSGNNNVVELVNTYANGDTGLQISGSATDSRDKWPANNLIKNCTSYDNRDASENNADGFAAKLQVGPGNKFTGCIAHNNTDDGWDLYSKLETGPIEPVIVENSVTYGNGTLSNGTKTNGDGNGFKLGGEGLAVPHVLRNSLSFKNNSNGVTNNSDPAVIVENVTSVDNGKSNFEFHYYTNATVTAIAKNNISFRTTTGIADDMPNLASEDNYFYNGTTSVNASGKQLLASDFKSVIAPATVGRNSDGSISVGDYMVIASKTVSISSIVSPAAVTVTEGKTATLPATVTAVYSDGTQKEVAVKWGNVDTSVVGTQTVEGTVEGYMGKVTITVNVEKEKATITITSIVSPAAVTVTEGKTATLPEAVTAVYSDGTQKEVSVKWGNVDTSVVGTQTVEGTVEGYTGKVTITVNVEKVPDTTPKPDTTEDKIIDNNITPENLKEIVSKAKPEEKIIINAQEKPVIEAEAFKALKGIDKEVSFKLESQGKTIIWSFNGKDIKDVNTSVDLTLNLDTANKDIINSIAPNSAIISFKNHGELPAPMKVSIPVDTNKFDISKPIYFYYYNETTKKAELVGDGLIAYKIGEVYYVDVILTHNSDFFMTDAKVAEIKTETEPKTETKTETETKAEAVKELVKTGSFVDFNVIASLGLVVMAMGIGFVFFRKKKEN